MARPMDQREMLKWHRDERASLLRQIDVYTSGKARFREAIDGVLIDTTSDVIGNLRKRVAELDRFLGDKAG